MNEKTVSVIVPCRNERQYIAAFCLSVARQQLPQGWQLQVIIADGQSDDGTRQQLQGLAASDPRFVCIDNPARIVSSALNAAIAASRGEVIVRMDVHTRYAPNYIAQCLATLAETGADNVGGPWRAQAVTHCDNPSATHQTSYTQQAIAAAFQSTWVSGGALSRRLCYSGWVDTVYLGAWSRATFERFGGFDENLVRNQDDEHNLRLIRAGGRVWQSSSIESAYFPRDSLLALFKQYQQYGYWKPFVMRKHGKTAALRHVMPGLFMAALLLAALLAGVWRQPAMLQTLVGFYALAVLFVACLITANRQVALPWSAAWRLPLVIATYHAAYGWGSLLGWFDVLRGKTRGRTTFQRLTR
jgi:succinoglycan biosynthesis protein ExoA